MGSPVAYVRVDIVVSERGHRHQGGFGTDVFKPSSEFLVPGSQRRSNEANAGNDLMSSSGKQAQHAQRVCFIAGLAENLALDDNDRVRAQNELAGLQTEYGPRLLPRQTFRAVLEDSLRLAAVQKCWPAPR